MGSCQKVSSSFGCLQPQAHAFYCFAWCITTAHFRWKHKPWTTLWQHVYTELLLHSPSFPTWVLTPLGVKHIIGVITDIRQGECHLGRWTGPVVQFRKPSSLFAKAFPFHSTCLTPVDRRSSSWNKADAVAMGYWRAAAKETYFMNLA